MVLLDANVLLHAYHPRSEEHARCRAWVENAFSRPEPVCLAWATILAFLRIGTNARVFEQPLSITEAEQIVTTWLAQPTITILEPGNRYWSILRGLLHSAQVTGPLVTDASLAALALEHGAVICTTDRDFLRFPEVRTVSPLAD